MKKSVLIPLDGSPFSRQIMPHIRHVLDPEAYRLTLLQVGEPSAGMLGVPPPPFSSNWPLPVHAYGTARDVERARHPIYASQQEHNTCAEIETALSAEQALLRDAGYAVSVSVRFGDPAEEIVAYARDTDIDLVAMATHGRTGLRQLIMGSVAEQVLRRLAIPLMLVRPFADET
jgi:nucleotide-binding universal stress UspA family protein